MTRSRRMLTWLVAFNLGLSALLPAAHAGLVSTEAVAETATAATPEAGTARARLADLMQRQDVIDALRARGVSAQAARERVAALTDTEAAQLADQIDRAPAGADALGVIVGIFVLLLITDILGFTKIFPFTRSIR